MLQHIQHSCASGLYHI